MPTCVTRFTKLIRMEARRNIDKCDLDLKLFTIYSFPFVWSDVDATKIFEKRFALVKIS